MSTPTSGTFRARFGTVCTHVNQDSLCALRTCLFSWSTEPTKPLPIPDILHDFFLKTGNPHGCPHDGTVTLLYRNLTDGSRYPDPHTTTILAQCTYILNRSLRSLRRLPYSLSFTVPSFNKTRTLLKCSRSASPRLLLYLLQYTHLNLIILYLHTSRRTLHLYRHLRLGTYILRFPSS